ncbi:hypothetical protein NKI67_18410 [Mesorhizobium sp. M0408]
MTQSHVIALGQLQDEIVNAGERCPLHGIAGSASAMFSRMDRLKSTFSCKTTPISRRSQVAVDHRHIDATAASQASSLRHSIGLRRKA